VARAKCNVSVIVMGLPALPAEVNEINEHRRASDMVPLHSIITQTSGGFNGSVW
jgi:hypothetical protein